MASAANSGKTNREIVTDWYTRYAEEIAGYENTLANLNIQLTQAQQADAETLRKLFGGFLILVGLSEVFLKGLKKK